MSDGKKEKKREKEKQKSKKHDSREEKHSATASAATSTQKTTVNLLVIDSDNKDWYSLFADVKTTSGQTIVVEKTRWENMMVSSSSSGQCTVNLRPNEHPLPNTKENQARSFNPDFVLVRKLVRGLTHDESYDNILLGLMYAGLPSVNSLLSVKMCSDRPVLYAGLNEIKKRLGSDKFPLISQSYYSHQNTMIFTPDLPFVAKIGNAQAGYGKMRFMTSDDFSDFRGVLALHKDFCTLESFIKDREYDLRIQKVGSHYRVYKRVNSNWKGNVGSSIITEIPLTDKYKLWADEAAKLFGGMDILTVDSIFADGKDYILEVNDTASGFYTPNEKEDMQLVRDLVLEKIEAVVK